METPESRVEVGNWYLCAICPNCQQAIPMLGPLQAGAPISGDGTIVYRNVACPHCGQTHDHLQKSFQRLQAKPTAPRNETIQ